MAPSNLGPVMSLEDSNPFKNEICSIRFPLDMSLADTTNPSTWSGTHGQSGSAHSCIVLDLEPNDDASAFNCEVLMMRSFGTGGQNSPFTDILLPLPFGFGAPPPSTPVSFGVPLKCGIFEPLKETWIVAHIVKINLRAESKIKRYVPTKIFPREEVARIKAFVKSREKVPMSLPTLLLGGTLTPATTGSHLNSPSSSKAALAGGTTARLWSQVAKEGLNKTAADKAVTDKTTADTERRTYEEEWPRYMGPDSRSAFPLPHDYSELPGDLVIPFSKELNDLPWNDSDDESSSSSCPPIPLLIAMEREARVVQSNEDVKVWLSKT